MALFKRRARPIEAAFDPATQQVAVRRSICTGEMTVGFVDRQTGRFQDVGCVEDQQGLEDFCRRVGARVEDVKTIY